MMKFRAIYKDEEGNTTRSQAFTLEDILFTYGFEFNFEDGGSLPLKDCEEGDVQFEEIFEEGK